MNDAGNQVLADRSVQTELACPVCDTPLKPGATGQVVDITCPSCGAGIQAAVFPALFRPRAAAGETRCFYHKDKKAVVPCSVCGRFLCALCDIHMHGRHLCPACMTSCKQGRDNLENHRLLYDKIALYLSIIPFTIFLWFMAIITAPAAIFVVIRYWPPTALCPAAFFGISVHWCWP